MKKLVLTLKKYISLFEIKFSNTIQYRAAALAGIATQFAWGGLEILLYSAFYKAAPEVFPMKFSQLSSYIWLQQALLAMFMTWFVEADIFNMIIKGDVAYELIRPVGLYSMWFVKNMAGRAAKATLRSLPIIIIAAVLPAPYGLSLPASIPAFLMFLLTLILAFLLAVSYVMLIYIACFFTMSPMGIRIIAVSVAEIFTGSLIPLPFMPEGFRRIAELTPFASMQNLPFRIYSGNIAGAEILSSVLLQVFWLFALCGGGILLMRVALRRVAVQGG